MVPKKEGEAYIARKNGSHPTQKKSAACLWPE